MRLNDSTSGSSEERVNKLAKANLCRMRGEYDQAEALCVEILQSNPDRVEAMAILGDLCAEKGELHKAKHWFTMAADIKPPLPGVVDKLNLIKARIEREEQSMTAVVQAKKAFRNQKLITIIAICCVAGAIIGAIAAGLGRSDKPVTMPIVTVGSQPESNPAPAASGSADSASVQPAYVSPALQLLLKLGRPEVKLVQDALFNPRSSTLTIVADLPSNGDSKSLAGQLGADGLLSERSASRVTIQLVQSQKVIFVADLLRSDYENAATDGSAPSDASSLLTNAWPADSAAASQDPSNSKPADGSSNTGQEEGDQPTPMPAASH